MASIQTLPVRPCGSQGLKLPIQGLGCMGMSMGYVTVDHPVEESYATLERALELGVNHLDTSDFYGWGENEKLLSKTLEGRREKFIVATKFGNTKDGVKGSPEHVKEAFEASLQRLGTDYVDLYYQHRVDRTIPIEDTWRALKELVEAGKVKYLGISEASADEIRRAHAIHPISACQLEWSLWTRNAEEEIIPLCRELGIGIVAYSPLGRGFLTGTFAKPSELAADDWRRNMPRFAEEAFAKNLELVERVRTVASAKGVTPGQLALAWVHAQGDDVFPIPGTKKVKYLEENVAAASIQLSKDELAELEGIFTPDKVIGDRYQPQALKYGFEFGSKAASDTN